jgi:opacity protein-like surface antigen
MRRSRAPLLLPALVAAALLVPSVADAYERQWHAGVSLGYAYLSTEVPTEGPTEGPTTEAAGHGFGGGLHLTYGINDMFNVMAELDLTAHPSGSLLAGSASAGVSYVVDILQVVPYVGLMAGGYDLWTTSGPCGAEGLPSCHSGRLGGSIPFGLDYTVTRSFTIGFAGRYHLLFLGPGSVEQMFTAFARAELVWGY